MRSFLRGKFVLVLLAGLVVVFLPLGTVYGEGKIQRPPAASADFEMPLVAHHVKNPSSHIVPKAAASSWEEVLLLGGQRLAATQNHDGGWDWPLDDGDPENGSTPNTLGPIAMGLAKAYEVTQDPTLLSALVLAGNYLLDKTNNFSPSDGYLAAELDSIFGVTTYVDHMNLYFYGPLANGTYDYHGEGTLYDTAGYIQLIRDHRTGDYANIAAWDIGIGLVAAAMCGADTSDWIAGVKAEIDELDATKYYAVLGLAGAIYGLAYVNEDYDPQAGSYADASSLADLAAILATYQMESGGFTWMPGEMDPGDETTQETAYAVLALKQFDPATYALAIEKATAYLASHQMDTGGWNNAPSENDNTDQEYNEVTGEALWAVRQDTAPTVSVEQAIDQPDPTNLSPVHFVVTFSQPIDVATFTTDDLLLGGSAGDNLVATITETSPNDGTTFDIAVTGMSGEGQVTVAIPEGKVLDKALHANLASTSVDNAVTYDLILQRADYNGDGKDDIAVFRPEGGVWWIWHQGHVVYGQRGDIPVPADYDGDGKSGIAVFRPSTGTWWIRGQGHVTYGQVGDIPVPADYNGDGKSDIAVFRPSTGTWWIRGQGHVTYGQPGDIPVPADYNGDGRTDIAIFRPSTGTWWIRGQGHVVYGHTGDIPVPGDYNGDGRAEIAVYRPGTHIWWIRGVGHAQYGGDGDLPVPADYNADGSMDIAIFRPATGTWWIRGQGHVVYGQGDDVPLMPQDALPER